STVRRTSRFSTCATSGANSKTRNARCGRSSAGSCRKQCSSTAPATTAARSCNAMINDVYRRFGLDNVINAAGKMTALGGTAHSDVVAQAQADAARSHVDLETLRRRAGELVARHTGADAASITSGAAAGIAIAVAACITGTQLDRVLRIPDADGLDRRVLLQAGHDINFGASVTQMIRLGGGVPDVVGWVNSVPTALLERAFAATDIAAFVYVQSH